MDVGANINPSAEELYQYAVMSDIYARAIYKKKRPTIGLLNIGEEGFKKRKETLEKIYITGEITTWGEVVGKPEITDEIHVYTRSDACGAAEMGDKFLGDKLQEDLVGIAVNADPGLLEAVVKDPLGIGFNNLGYAFDLASGQVVNGAAVAPIDLNADGIANDTEWLETMPEAIDAVATGKYPSPPARALNLVARDNPTGLVQTLILWILNEGQAC